VSLKKEWENLSLLTKITDKYKNKQDKEMLLFIRDNFNEDCSVSDLLINIHDFERERILK